MLFRTRIKALRRGPLLGKDAHGKPIYGPDIEQWFYGDLRPLSGEEIFNAGGTTVITRFRLFTPPMVTLDSTTKITAFGSTYAVVSEPEPHNIGGQLHHYEVLVERRTG